MAITEWISTYTDEEWLAFYANEGDEWLDTLPAIEYNVVLSLNTVDNTYYYYTESITHYYYTKDQTQYLETKNVRRN